MNGIKASLGVSQTFEDPSIGWFPFGFPVKPTNKGFPRRTQNGGSSGFLRRIHQAVQPNRMSRDAIWNSYCGWLRYPLRTTLTLILASTGESSRQPGFLRWCRISCIPPCCFSFPQSLAEGCLKIRSFVIILVEICAYNTQRAQGPNHLPSTHWWGKLDPKPVVSIFWTVLLGLSTLILQSILRLKGP